jgi:hypothetical protein
MENIAREETRSELQKAQIVLKINADNDKPLSLGTSSKCSRSKLDKRALQAFLVLQNCQRGTKMSWQWHWSVHS